jgi:hypothetical protein
MSIPSLTLTEVTLPGCVIGPLSEAAEGFKPSPFDKILTAYGFTHRSSAVEPNRFNKDPKHDMERHIWDHKPGRSHAEVWMYRSGDKHWIVRWEQPNGIMSPTSGDTKGQLERTLERDFSKLHEGWDQSGPPANSKWTGEHGGYEFMVVAWKRGSRITVATQIQSLPKARVIARDHHRTTRETVTVLDTEGRKYYTL